MLQFNANGLMSGYTELTTLLARLKVGVACIQETKLQQHSTYRDPENYTSLRKDRPSGGAGGELITLIHQSLTYNYLPTDHLFPDDSVFEHLGVAVTIGNMRINIINV